MVYFVPTWSLFAGPVTYIISKTAHHWDKNVLQADTDKNQHYKELDLNPYNIGALWDFSSQLI